MIKRPNPRKTGLHRANQVKAVCANPLDRLCLLFLEWNFAEENDENIVFNEVPLLFQSFQEYVSIWEPLMIHEFRASVSANCQSSSISSFNFKIFVHNEQEVNNPLLFIQLQIKSSNTEKQKTPGLMDLILLSNEVVNYLPFLANNSSKSKDSQQLWLLGIVTSTNNRTIICSALRSRSTHFLRSCKQEKFGGVNSFQIYGTVITNITSQWREFHALHDAYNIPLIHKILKSPNSAQISNSKGSKTLDGAIDYEFLLYSTLGVQTQGKKKTTSDIIDGILGQPNVGHRSGEKAVEVVGKGGRDSSPPPQEGSGDVLGIAGVGPSFVSHLRSTLNHSQLHAVKLSVEKQSGFNLIQGPPGTGKTSTILALLNALHVRDYNKYFESAIHHATSEIGIACRSEGQTHAWAQMVSVLSKAKPHILVVAPSNVAVDHIVQRTISDGFKDDSGCLYYPNIVRIGSGSRKTSEAVSLDEIVDKICNISGEQRSAVYKETLQKIDEVILHIIHHQTILLNMKLCFDSHPLPAGWEIRVVFDNAQPYWVDHNTKSTFLTPPILLTANTSKMDSPVSTYSLSSLPEYKIHAHTLTQLLEELGTLHLKKCRFEALLNFQNNRTDSTKDFDKYSNSVQNAYRQAIEQSVINEAHIVFSTLNSSGHPCLEGTNFPVVIVDEAGQCIEPSILISLRHGCTHGILVGDQAQLSATLFATSLNKKNFNRSLFERFYSLHGHASDTSESIEKITMLDTQYRMHPEISRFPSQRFYSSNLKDGENVRAADYGLAFLNSSTILRPYMFLNLCSSRDSSLSSKKASDSDNGGDVDSESSTCAAIKNKALRSGSKNNDNDDTESGSTSFSSISNIEEANLVIHLLHLIAKEAQKKRRRLEDVSIGIITPYQEQLKLVSNMVADSHTLANFDVELNTVDAFQGREKDIIIITCVRSNELKSIGFLADVKRLNVALTRAKYGLYVIGNANTLASNKCWSALIENATSRSLLVNIPNSCCDIENLFYEHFNSLGYVKINLNQEIEDGEVEDEVIVS